ncbi:MAG: hydroxyacid dehydrogenase [Pseudorhodoplanes sp.]|jgi:(S)-sulfolactate dehydrogenase|nr:hydroxyacid dehydrogenase [Pseudorhodoplanes sp.]
MSDIVITEFMQKEAIDELLAGFDVHYDKTLVDNPEKIPPLLSDARALIVRNRTKVTKAILEAAPRLECVGRLGVGLDNIDLSACKARGITVYPAIGANEVTVAEYVMGAILVMMRKGVYAATEGVLAGKWMRNELMGRDLSGKQLGLIGYGNNARKTAFRALAFDMNVVAYDPNVPASDAAWTHRIGVVTKADLDPLIATSDVISLHLPVTPQTKNLIDAKAIGRMKRGALLVNPARGGIVDEAAVVEALKSGQLGGAMLDVFVNEPLSAETAAPFKDAPNLLLSPHVAGVTVESDDRTNRITAENVRRHLTKA